MIGAKAPKVGAGLVAVAAALFAAAIGLSDSAADVDANSKVFAMALVGAAGLSLGVAAIAGFIALKNGVTGPMRALSIALCVAPALLGLGLGWRVYGEMESAKEAAAQAKPGVAKPRAGPPAKVALDPKEDAPTPDVKSAPVARVLFDLDPNADRDAFKKGTWFIALDGEPLLLTAGHLFGPYAALEGRLTTPLSPDARAAIAGTATFDGPLGTATQGAPLRVKGRAHVRVDADLASFRFENAAKIFPLPKGSVGAPFQLAAVPSPGSPVWVVTLDGDVPSAHKAVVASAGNVVAAYLDQPLVTFDGVSGAPIVDKDGNAVAVFIGKSMSKNGAVVVGTPLLGVLSPSK